MCKIAVVRSVGLILAGSEMSSLALFKGVLGELLYVFRAVKVVKLCF